jgi:hypothetical protein
MTHARVLVAAVPAMLLALPISAQDRGPQNGTAGAQDGRGLVVESQGPNTRVRVSQSARNPQSITSAQLSRPYCTQPDPRQDACFLNFSFLGATDSGSGIAYVTVSVNGKAVFRLNSFFENSISADHTFPGLGFRVPCGPPVNDPWDSAVPPRKIGNLYQLKVEFSEVSTSNLTDIAAVYCPPYQP